MIATTMQAARLHEVGAPLRIDTVPVPQPGPGQVLIEVEACGLCGTDIHLAVAGDIPVSRVPIILGHEAAGTIAALGEGVGGFTIGQRVALFPSAICGKCRFCRAGRESLCEATQAYGMSEDGALARAHGCCRRRGCHEQHDQHDDACADVGNSGHPCQ